MLPFWLCITYLDLLSGVKLLSESDVSLRALSAFLIRKIEASAEYADTVRGAFLGPPGVVTDLPPLGPVPRRRFAARLSACLASLSRSL